MKALEVRDLVKRYGVNDNVIAALGGVSFDIDEGEFVAVVGKSGSGKSTLMHILGGIEVFDSGSVIVAGNELANMGKDRLAGFRRKHVGIIYQFYNLVSVLNVEENIILPSQLDKKPVDYNRLDELMNLLAISDRRKHFPSQLSGGQQQRVAIARALYSNPSIILADEPTGNLDSANSKEVIKALNDLNKKYKKTIILITHDMQIADVADTIITLEDGLIVNIVRKHESII